MFGEWTGGIGGERRWKPGITLEHSDREEEGRGAGDTGGIGFERLP